MLNKLVRYTKSGPLGLVVELDGEYAVVYFPEEGTHGSFRASDLLVQEDSPKLAYLFKLHRYAINTNGVEFASWLVLTTTVVSTLIVLIMLVGALPYLVFGLHPFTCVIVYTALFALYAPLKALRKLR